MYKNLVQCEQEIKRLQSFAALIHQLIDRLLFGNGTKVHAITYRVKDVSSLYKKAERKRVDGKFYKELNHVTDVVGVRVILYFRSDIDIVVGILKKAFNVIEELDIKKKYTSNNHGIGYRAKHLTLSLDEKRLQLQEYSPFRGSRCEVQITTVLEHAWSEIEHDLLFKSRQTLSDSKIQHLENKFSSIAEYIRKADSEIHALNDIHPKHIS